MNNLQSKKPKNVITTLSSCIKTVISSKPMSKPSTMKTKMTTNGGAFSHYQRNRFWSNFNHDLYNRICEIKMNEQ